MQVQSAKRLVEMAPSRGVSRRPSSLSLERRVDGQLWATLDGEEQPVWLSRCFPWSDPTRFISLRDRDDEEFALVREPSDLDADSCGALEAGLAEAGFVLEIIGIERCEEEVEIRTWLVRTRQGPRAFQTRRDDWPRDIPGGGLLIRDVSGDLFYVPDTKQLDPESRAVLWAFVD